jgi:hypothetical protein
VPREPTNELTAVCIAVTHGRILKWRVPEGLAFGAEAQTIARKCRCIFVGLTPLEESKVVDTINELSDLSRRLNQKSDQLNDLISSINGKLAKFNFGIEVWTMSEAVMAEGSSMAFLGYTKIEDEWQLAVWDRDDVLRTEDSGGLHRIGQNVWPLLKVSRKVRLQAMPLVPRLLDDIKRRAEELLNGLAQAEEAAENL